MDFVKKLKDRISEAPIGSEERITLLAILGEYTRSRQSSPAHFIQKWIKDDEDQKRRFRRDPKEVSSIDFEIDILRSLLED